MTGTLMCGRRRNGGAAQAAPLRSGLARLVGAALLMVPLVSTGCYSYSVIDPAQAGAGLDVRARITPVESARLEELTGLRNRVIQGQIVQVESTAVVLSVPTLLSEPGMSANRLHQRITLPNSAIVELEQRQLSRWRTFSLIGAAAAVAGYIVVSQFDSDDTEPGTDKPGSNNLVLSIRAGFR